MLDRERMCGINLLIPQTQDDKWYIGAIIPHRRCLHISLWSHQVLKTSSWNRWPKKYIPDDLPETLDRSRMFPASSPRRQGWLHTVLRVCQNLCFAYNWQALGDCTGDYAQILDKCSAWGAKYQTDQLERRSKHGSFFWCSIIYLRNWGRVDWLCSLNGSVRVWLPGPGVTHAWAPRADAWITDLIECTPTPGETQPNSRPK